MSLKIHEEMRSFRRTDPSSGSEQRSARCWTSGGFLRSNSETNPDLVLKTRVCVLSHAALGLFIDSSS